MATNDRPTTLAAFTAHCTRLGVVPTCPVCAVSGLQPKNGPRWAVDRAPVSRLNDATGLGLDILSEILSPALAQTPIIRAFCRTCGFAATFATDSVPIVTNAPDPATASGSGG